MSVLNRWLQIDNGVWIVTWEAGSEVRDSKAGELGANSSHRHCDNPLPGSVEPGIGGYLVIVDKLPVGHFTLHEGCVGLLFLLIENSDTVASQRWRSVTASSNVETG